MKSSKKGSGGIWTEIRPEILSCNKATLGMACLSVLAAILWLNIGAMVDEARAGTEDGSFCPTCPDWTNLEGWYSQENAYSEAELQKILRPNSSGRNPNTSQSIGNSGESAEKEQAAYPVPKLFKNAADDITGVILDARSPEEYRAGHIPGAHNLYWQAVRANGAFNSTLLVAALSGLGVNRSEPIVVYGNGDDSSYLFWALEFLGQDNISRIDGGIAAWRAAGRPIVTNEPDPSTSNYVPLVRTWLMTDLEMLNHSGVQILDARESFADFGRLHLKNAIPIQASSLFTDAGTLLEPSALEGLFLGRGIDREKIQIVYGMPYAGDLYYVLRLMGYKPTMLDGEWWRDYAVSNIR